MKVGIDLGTTFSVVARYDPEQSNAVVITNDKGLLLTPTVLSFSEGANPVAGDDAYELLKANRSHCVTDFKKTLGMDVKYKLAGKEYLSSDLYTIMYRHLVRMAESSAGEKIEAAAITVPAYFNDIQRNAAKNAAISAGIPDVRVLNEPTAAAICYGYRRKTDRTVMVYDLGGGTIDVTVCRVHNNSIEVIGTAGNHLLGGNNWNNELLDYVSKLFEADFGVNPGDDPAARERLLEHADSYKKLLSEYESVEYRISYGGDDGVYTINRRVFEDLTAHLMSATLDVIHDVRVDGEPLDPSTVDEVLLVGGSTRMPGIRSFLVTNGFPEIVELSDSDVDTAVAKGAAIAAALINNRNEGLSEFTVSDATSISLGLLTEDDGGEAYRNTILIPKGSKYPVSNTGHLRIRENNVTDHLDVYVLQGESLDPADCTVLAKRTVTGFVNSGAGMVFDITLSYDSDGIVEVFARHGDQELTVTKNDTFTDTAWMRFSPKEKSMDTTIAKEVVFIADMSRSMWPHAETVRDCIRGLANKLDGESTTFSLIGFGDKCRMECGPGDDLDALLDAVGRMKPGYLGHYGPGTSGDPLSLLLDESPKIDHAIFAIIITDGNWESRDRAVSSARDCRNEKIILFTVCYGDEPDRSFIRQLSDRDANSLFTTVDNLRNVTDTIAIAVRNCSTGLREIH